MSQAHAARARRRRHPLTAWWRRCMVDTVDHRSVLEKVREEARWSPHFAFMTAMSAGIAVLGLLLSSPAVVIGAMLISPLMGPIVGFGFALATFDSAEIKRTTISIAAGSVLAVLFCALIVMLSPLQAVTEEIAARTRPNLFDLLVAVFSGLAGTYAMIRGRQGAIVGVAIAVAVMPPLAVMGFGLATFNLTVLSGSTFLFFTNLIAIGIMAAVLARLYGFGHRLSPSQTGLQATLVVALMIALAIPLGLALRQIAWEAVASRYSREVIAQRFGGEARVDRIAIDYEARPVRISATVFTPAFQTEAERVSSQVLSTLLGYPVEVTIDQLRVGTADAEASQLAAARAGRVAEQREQRVAERLALVAGVSPDAILIDRGGERAVVRAAALPGASLATYHMLEARVAQAEPGWQVRLIPPAAALDPVTFDGNAPDEAGRRAIAAAAWGARRLRLRIGVSGERADRIEQVSRLLAEAGAEAEPAAGDDGPPGAVTLRWLPPETGER